MLGLGIMPFTVDLESKVQPIYTIIIKDTNLGPFLSTMPFKTKTIKLRSDQLL